MQFNLNTNVRQEQIDSITQSNIDRIKQHLDEGKTEIELLIDNEFASEVKSKLVDLFEGQFDWLTIRREPNQYTGRMQYFTSERIGDQRRYKIRYITK